MWISRKVYNDLKREHDKVVEALTAWIEYMQAKEGAPTAPNMVPSTTGFSRALGGAAPPDMALYQSDDESDLRDAHEMGLIDDDSLEAGLQQIALSRQTVAS